MNKEWISVYDKLPPVDERVLTYATSDDFIDIGMRSNVPLNEDRSEWGVRWIEHDSDPFIRLIEVQYWMPLPGKPNTE